ncbi:MAG: TetR/AcrR family transcriptional regulator [Proteobacteria bacterium]|nr:TetR/AcrR family transcriptional regulator [Pseudomonadota bacterium]
MARTAKHSKPELREMALEAARAIVAEDGMRNLTVRAVAARMGYSVGTMYNIFEGLEELVAWLNAETLDQLHGALVQAPVTGEPETDLHALLDRYLEFIAANRPGWNMIFEERLPEAAAPPAWYMEKVAQVFTLLGRVLKPLFAPGEEAELTRAVHLLWIAMHGVWTLDAGGKLFIVTQDPVEKVAHEMVDLYLAGLRGRKGA